MKFEINSYIDIFAKETEDGSEWGLWGWIFVPGDFVWSGHLELEGRKIGPISCGWPRPDVIAAFPSKCPSKDVGFRSHVFLPPGLRPGEHVLELVFFNERLHEMGRLTRTFVTEKETARISGVAGSPVVGENIAQAIYLDLLEKTILGLPYAQDQQSYLCKDGRDRPPCAHSMIGSDRMRNLRACAETALMDKVPGDFMETGVWRGGAGILLRGVLRAYNDVSRNVWMADSFEGVPVPNTKKYPADAGSTLHTIKELTVTMEQVQEHFRRFDLLDGQVKFLKGWFSQSLPNAPIDKLALLRLDGDMYESTLDALTHLYPKLSPGGYCIIDDYGCFPACRQAVRDYRKEHNIKEPMAMIDWTGAWWRKL